MSYAGNKATISLGDYGLITDLPPGMVPPGGLILAHNVSYETGSITKCPGSLKYNSAALPAGIVALHDWWPDPATQRLIAACSNGSIYRDIGDKVFSGGVAITSGLSSLDTRSLFVEGGAETAARSRKLFYFTGTNQLKVLSGDGTSFATVSNPAADWTAPNYPTFGFVHRNRLWAFMGQRYYASDSGDHENFVSADILTGAIFPGEGGNLIGGFIFKGRAFVFKEDGFVYYLNDTDTSTTNWYWIKLDANFGLASSHSICATTNDMVALSQAGNLISYNAVNTYGGIDNADVFKQLMIAEYVHNNTSSSGLRSTHMTFYEARRQLFITSRKSYGTANNLLIMIDYNRERPRVAFWDKDAADCLTQMKDINKIKRPIYGAADGFVYLMDKEDRLVGASAYTGEFKTGHHDFRWLDPGIVEKNKIFDHLSVEFVPQGNWNLSVDVYIDGKFIETVLFPMTVKDDGLDHFTLDTDALGREESQTITMPLHGSGRRISFRCKQAGSNQNFAISSLTVGFRLSAEQATSL